MRNLGRWKRIKLGSRKTKEKKKERERGREREREVSFVKCSKTINKSKKLNLIQNLSHKKACLI